MNRLLSLFYIVIIVSFGFAQQRTTLSGQVTDILGAVVAGASVSVIDSNNRERTVVTNQRGEFSVTGLEPGKYTVRVTAPTFDVYENSEVEIVAGQKNELVVVLSAAKIEEVVEVGGNDRVSTDADNNQSATIIKGKDLESLPEDPDELEAALIALAGPSVGPSGGQIYIDGFTGGRIPPRDAIREIRINQNPFSAEFDRLGFGRIEILTRPGSDKWRGQAFFNFNDETLNSRNPFATNRAPSQTRFYGANISGPLQKGKSSFFLDISNREINNTAVVNATVLDSAFNVVPFRREYTVPTRRFSISPRFDYQINQNNTLVLRYSYTRNSAENQGIGGFSLISRAFETSNVDHEIQLTETMVINAKTVNETRFRFEYDNREQRGDNSIPTINVSSAFTGGGAQIGFNYNREYAWEFQNYTTTSFGKNNQHAVKFGVRIRGTVIRDRSESGFGGTFVFTGFPAIGDPCDVNNDNFVSSIEQYRCKVMGRTETRYNPSQFVLTAGDPFARASQYDVGVFITDDWRVRPDLTLSLGLRYENQTGVSDNLNFAPRFSFAWAPGAGGARQPKLVVRGGAGIFYDRFGVNNILQIHRFDGTRQIQYIVPAGAAILSQPVFLPDGTVLNTPTASQLAPFASQTNTIRQASPDLQAPYTIQAVIGVEKQLPMRTTMAAFFVFSRNLHVLRIRNINAPVCGLTTPCPTNQSDLQALRPNPSLGNIYQYESTGILNQRQLVINFNSRFHPRISLFGFYRLGWAKGDAEGGGVGGFGGGLTFPAYSYDLSGEYGRSVLGVRHFASIRGSITLPWNITFNPFILISSGVPFNITTGIDSNRDSIFTERPTFGALAARCQALGLTKSWCDISGKDPNAIIPRNYGVGPGNFTFNLNVNKTFGFGGSRRNETARSQTDGQIGNRPTFAGIGGPRGGDPQRGGFGGGFGGSAGSTDKPYNLTIGLQISNLLNRNNKGIPVGNLNSPFFGQSVSTAGGFGFFGGGGGSNSGNRRVELQVRFSW
ncbi:MAG: TonB-dependent receptor [Pyrinomonadaceae bacterium]|nr:TonB-dependent receptor [Pyrinomonadaceae bacterium]MCX7640558.1 TonB-dependent receptor [Pyrinomonadaceae bacterium]MDW8303861.1 TonB-dependent receptor [Acidobacteriota bacterium]